MASRRASTICSIIGRIDSARRTVNSRLSIRLIRMWASPSERMNVPLSGDSTACARSTGKFSCFRSALSRESSNSLRTASCPATSQACLPLGSATGNTPCLARSSRCTSGGWNGQVRGAGNSARVAGGSTVIACFPSGGYPTDARQFRIPC